MGVRNQVSFSSIVRTVYGQVNNDASFTVIVFKCPGPNCNSCTVYNAEKEPYEEIELDVMYHMCLLVPYFVSVLYAIMEF